MSQKKDLARIKKLLKSPEHHAQAVGLLQALGEDALWQGVLSDLEFTRSNDGFVRIGRTAVALLSEAPAHVVAAMKWPEALDKIHVNAGIAFAPRAFPDTQHLTLQGRRGASWDFFGELTHLQALVELRLLSGHAPDVDALGELPKLETLRADYLTFDGELPALPALRYLRMRNNQAQTLPPMPRLERADLWACDQPLALDGLGASDQLAVVASTGVSGITSLAPLAGAIARGAPLRSVTLQSADKLSSLEGLEGATQLEELAFQSCQVHSLAPLAECVRLQELTVKRGQLISLEGLEGAAGALQIVDVRENGNLEDVSALADAKDLRALALYATKVRPEDLPEAVRHVATWAPMPHFETLRLRPALGRAG